MPDNRGKRAGDASFDRELKRERSLAALEALHAMMEGLPLGTEVRSEHVAALLDVILAAGRHRADDGRDGD